MAVEHWGQLCHLGTLGSALSFGHSVQILDLYQYVKMLEFTY